MEKATIVLDRRFRVGEVSDDLFDSFVEHLGRNVYGGVYDPESPAADEEGFRRDLMEKVREARIPKVRYPGGNFSSGYRWEDGIGPVELRPKRLDLAFQSLETNRIGTDEFMRWCKKAGTDCMMTVNLGTRGVDEARDLFEYCNHPGGSALSDLRRRYGSEQPYDIHTWCLGNEIDGDWQIGHRSAEDYGKVALETAKTFRWMKPDTEIIICGSSSPEQPTLGSWESTVLDFCYDQADLVDYHIYFKNDLDDTQNYLCSPLRMDRYIQDGIACLDFIKAKKKSRKQLNLAFTEWNVWFILEDTDHRTRYWDPAPSLLEDYFTFEDALVVGDLMLSMIKRADRVKTACISQLVNVNAPLMTNVGGSGIYCQPTWYPFLHASLYGRGVSLNVPVTCSKVDTKQYTDAPLLSAAAVWNEEKEQLALFAINRSVTDDMLLEADVRNFEDYEVKNHIVLSDSDPKAINTLEDPDRVAPVTGDPGELDGGMYSVKLGRMSWNVIIFGKKEETA